MSILGVQTFDDANRRTEHQQTRIGWLVYPKDNIAQVLTCPCNSNGIGGSGAFLLRRYNNVKRLMSAQDPIISACRLTKHTWPFPLCATPGNSDISTGASYVRLVGIE